MRSSRGMRLLPGDFDDAWRHLRLSQAGEQCHRRVGEEVRVTARCPPTTRSYPARSVSSAEVGKPWSVPILADSPDPRSLQTLSIVSNAGRAR